MSPLERKSIGRRDSAIDATTFSFEDIEISWGGAVALAAAAESLLRRLSQPFCRILSATSSTNSMVLSTRLRKY